jgi:protein involved in polysaccharide export with SLBB domain
MIANGNCKRVALLMAFWFACWSIGAQNTGIGGDLSGGLSGGLNGVSGMGGISSSQAADILRALQSAGIGGTLPFPSTNNQRSTEQAGTSQNAANQQNPVPGTNLPGGMNIVQAPAGPSSIESMFAPAVPQDSPPLRQFGYDFFSQKSLSSFTAVGDDYVVGPGDVLTVYIWGDAVDIANMDSLYQLPVDRNGLCFFPPVGSFTAWGLDLQSVKAYLKSALSKKYKKFDLTITLSQIRQFPVYVAGFVNSPGVVMTNAASSLFDVISQAGGIMKTGSLRNIVLTHKGQEKGTAVDLYDVLISGKSKDIQVRENDSILVREIGTVVGVTGAVKRPSIYELKGEKTVSDLIGLAGGLLPSAYPAGTSVVRFDSEHRLIISGGPKGSDIVAAPLMNGDLVRVDPVRDLLVNRIDVDGEIKFPGSYSLDSMPTLRALLDRVKPMPDTNLFYARICRTEKGGYTRNCVFQPRKVLDGLWDAPLQALDRVSFFRFGDDSADADLDSYPETMTMEGPIRYPGMYAWSQGMRLKEILSSQEFLIDTNLQYAEIRRHEMGSGSETILTFCPEDVVDGKADVELKPLDRIRFFPKAIDPPIEVSGSVKESKVVLYYDGINLVDILRMVSLDGDTKEMKAFIYRETPPQPAATGYSVAQVNVPQQSPLTNTSQIVQPMLQPQPIFILPSQPSQPQSQAFPGQGSLYPNQAVTQQVAQAAANGPQVQPTAQTIASQAVQAALQSNPNQMLAQPNNQGQPAQNQSAATQQPTQDQSSQPAQTSPTAPSAPGLNERLPSRDRFVVYLRDFLGQQPSSDVPLLPGDRIVFAPTSENEKKAQITIRGQVSNPGAQLFHQGMRLSEALLAAGGFSQDAFPQGIVLLRKSAADLQREQLDRAADILSVTLSQTVNEAAAQAFSSVSGSDAAAIARLQMDAQRAEISALRKQISGVLGRISVHMPKTIEALAGTPDDLPLDDGDSIFIPKTPTFVQIIGEVFNPITVAYHEGLKVKDYLSTVGGITDNGDSRKTYMIRADGTVVSSKQKASFLFFTPTIDQDPVYAGDTIVVGKKEVTPNYILPVTRDISQVLANLASTALSVYAIMK